MADWYDFDKKMALINLNQIHEYAVKLDNIVTEETELEEWVKMKLTRIEQNVADVKKSLEGWEKFEEFGEGGRIFKKQLLHIAKYAKDLIAMIKLGSKLMSWQENKLAVSAEYIDAIYHHLDYKMGNRASDVMANGGGVGNYRVKAFTFNDDNQPKKEFDFYAKNDREAENKLNELIGKEYYQLVKVNRGDVSMTFENGKLDWDSDRKKYANGGGIKTDLNELENTELRNVLISFWNDFFNNHIGNYLSIEKENYILSNIDNVFVIVRDEDKGNFSDVEKQKIDRFLSPYFDSNKKPLFTDFFNKYEINDNKIIIYIKNMYANGGEVKFNGLEFELLDIWKFEKTWDVKDKEFEEPKTLFELDYNDENSTVNFVKSKGVNVFIENLNQLSEIFDGDLKGGLWYYDIWEDFYLSKYHNAADDDDDEDYSETIDTDYDSLGGDSRCQIYYLKLIGVDRNSYNLHFEEYGFAFRYEKGCEIIGKVCDLVNDINGYSDFTQYLNKKGMGSVLEDGGGVREYANGGGVGFERVTNMDDAVVSFLTKSNNFNYTNITVNHSGDNSFLFKYGTLIAKKVGKEVFITDKKYSKTTSKLQNLIKYTAEQKGFKVFQTEFFNAGGDLDLKIGKYEINPETFEVKDENGDIVHKAQTLSRAKSWAKSESKHDKDVVYENNSLEITRDAIGNLHFDFDRRRNTGWAFDTDDVGTAVAIISHGSINNDEKLRNIEINSRQLRDSDREMIVYWLSGGNKEWRFGDTYNKSFDETYKEIFDDVALKIKKLMQKEKTIGGLIDLFQRYDVDYFINYAQQEGSWGEYVYDEDYEREKEMDEELAEYEDGEDYAKEYILDNYKYKNTEEILNDLINYFEQEDIEYDEDRINDIIKETFESIDKQTLSLFKRGGAVGQYGGVGEIKAYKTKTGRLKKDTNGRILFIMPDGSQKYFFSVDWAKDYWSNKDKINKSKYANGGGVDEKEQSEIISEIEYEFGRKIGEIYQDKTVGLSFSDSDIIVLTDDWTTASTISENYDGVIEEEEDSDDWEYDYAFKITISKKYANGGGVGDYSEYSNDALKDMIINLSRYENTEGDIKIIKEELERRKSMYFVGGSVNEISKNQLENMVGKKLDGWNDDIVYYNGKKYQKCYLRPYYKVC